MNTDTLSKLLATAMFVLVLAAYTGLAIAHVTIPEFIAQAGVAILPLVAYIFGYNHGVATGKSAT